MAEKATTKKPADWSALNQLISFVIDYAKNKGFEDQFVWELELVSDEILTNIIRYAYPQETGMIEIGCHYKDPGELVIEIIDCGIPFNPLDSAGGGRARFVRYRYCKGED